jgi:hypothetical protein
VQNSGPGVAISLVLHALAAVALTKIAWKITAPPAPEEARVVWLGEWSLAPSAGAQRGRDEVDSERGAVRNSREGARPAEPNDSGAASVTEDVRLRIAPATPDPQPPSASDVPIDWAAARRRAIEDTAAERERGASYRSFSFPGTLAEEQAFEEEGDAEEREAPIGVGLPPPKTAFDSPSKGRAGLDDTNAFGQYVVWITDDCYQTYGTSNPFLVAGAAALFSAPATTCVPGEPRGDLFEGVKPSYLISRAERDDRAERLGRADRFDRNETGAVASFAN